jgi:L-asparaginase
MNRTALNICCGVLTTFIVLLLNAAAAQAKPKIMILATGGTIAGTQTSTSEAGYTSGSFSVNDLIKAVPATETSRDVPNCSNSS